METLKSQWCRHTVKIDSRKLVNWNTIVNMKDTEKSQRIASKKLFEPDGFFQWNCSNF